MYVNHADTDQNNNYSEVLPAKNRLTIYDIFVRTQSIDAQLDHIRMFFTSDQEMVGWLTYL